MVTFEQARKLGAQRLVMLLKTAVREERTSLVAVLVYLGEFDRRRGYADEGFSSTYAYCTKEIKYSEQAAFLRIRAARVCRKFPATLTYIREGELSLTSLSLLAAHLDNSNSEELLEKAKNKSRLQLEAILAQLGPRPAPRDIIRVEGVWTNGENEAGAAGADGGAPLPFRMRISFSADEPMVRDIERAKQVLFHKYPDGALVHIFKESLGILLNKADPDRRSKLKRPTSARPMHARPGIRNIPQWVKDQVWERDAGQCRFLNRRGQRCDEKVGLEYDHLIPFALGGKSDEPGNIRLLCKTHNNMHTQFDGGRA